MSTICKLNNIKIIMYPFTDDNRSEHEPPHIHITIDNVHYKIHIITKEQILDSKHNTKMKNKDLSKVINWMNLHEETLLKNWEIAKNKSTKFIKIS